jgi:hypothetical protein
MCDFSLTNVKSRKAEIGDKLISRDFGTGTKGFCAEGEEDTAICLMPGTELAFEKPVTTSGYLGTVKKHGTIAIFRQINKDKPSAHHDALEFPNGHVQLLTTIDVDARARVLQLPAAPKSEAEAKEQERLAYTG